MWSSVTAELCIRGPNAHRGCPLHGKEINKCRSEIQKSKDAMQRRYNSGIAKRLQGFQEMEIDLTRRGLTCVRYGNNVEPHLARRKENLAIRNRSDRNEALSSRGLVVNGPIATACKTRVLTSPHEIIQYFHRVVTVQYVNQKLPVLSQHFVSEQAYPVPALAASKIPGYIFFSCWQYGGMTHDHSTNSGKKYSLYLQCLTLAKYSDRLISSA